MFPTGPLKRSMYPRKFYFSEIAPLCLKNEVDIKRQKVPGGSCTQELQALFGCLKKWEFDDIPCAKLHTEYMRCVESAEKAAAAFKDGAKKGILGEGISKLSTAQFNKIMSMFPQPDLGVSQRRMKRLPHMSYADDLYRRKDKNKPN
uniref:CHCH domain-containing protein n=1 Tax=Panagrolaimus superbus TaxID=310955 RepID=A0A914Y2T5_9BILA